MCESGVHECSVECVISIGTLMRVLSELWSFEKLNE